MAKKSRLKTGNNSRRRFWAIVFVLCLAVIGALGAFRYKRQLVNLVNVWQETFTVVEPSAEDGLRGTIYDRNFKEFAQTLERVSLYVRPREVENVSNTAEHLSNILGLTEPEVLAALERDSHLVWLRRDIDQGDEESIAALNLPGVYFHREFARSYPQQEKASHLIGYSENDQGLAGVEHYYNRLLNHDRILQKDLQKIDLGGLEQTSGSGHDLVLTLDAKIQTILEEYVAKLGKAMGQGRISSLLLDVRTGEIVAGVNFPAYNPNSVWQNDNEALESLFFTQLVVPEKFRQFLFAASLLQVGWEDARQVLPWSLAPEKVSLGGQLRFWDRLKFTTDIKVDFSGEMRPRGNTEQLEGCVPAMEFGAVPKTATPLKILLGMGHLLNGGKKIQPHILHHVMERAGQREFLYNSFLGDDGGRRVLPSLVSAELQKLLLTQGKRSALGTSVLSDESVSLIPDFSGGRYVRDRMSLVAMPGEKPEIILFIVSRERKIGPGVTDTSGADFLSRDIDSILPSIIALQLVHQNLADMMEVQESEEENFKDGTKVPENLAGIFEKHILLMPDLKGLSLRKGLRLLQRAEVEMEITGSGRITDQSPAPGVELKQGDKVQLILKSDKVSEEVPRSPRQQKKGAVQ